MNSKLKKLCSIILLIAMMFTNIVYAPLSTSAFGPAQGQSDIGILSGILQGSNGDAVANTTVFAIREIDIGKLGTMERLAGYDSRLTTITDEDGYFVFDSLKAGTKYFLFVEKNDGETEAPEFSILELGVWNTYGTKEGAVGNEILVEAPTEPVQKIGRAHV